MLTLAQRGSIQLYAENQAATLALLANIHQASSNVRVAQPDIFSRIRDNLLAAHAQADSLLQLAQQAAHRQTAAQLANITAALLVRAVTQVHTYLVQTA